MKPDTAAAIIERIRANWPVADDVEITACERLLMASPGGGVR